MEDLTGIIDAINHLTEIVGNNKNTYIPMIVSTVLATIGSIAAVLILDAIKNSYIRPTEEFETLRNRVNSTLSLYACYYTNQIDSAHSDEKVIGRYINASDAIRMIAVELNAFTNNKKRKKFKGEDF